MLIRSRLCSLLCLLLLAPVVLFAQSRERDYLRRDYGRYSIIYCPEDSTNVESLAQFLGVRMSIVESQLRLALADTVRFVITPSEREWSRVTAGAPLWANGIAYANRGVAVLKSPRFGLPYGPLPVTAIHEYVHMLLEAGAPQAEIPRWLNEGLAQVLAGQMEFLDGQALGRAAVSGRIHSLWQLEGLMGMSATDARQGYAESAIAVQLLSQKYGLSGLSNLVHELRKGRRFDDAFATIFGISEGAFEEQYREHIRRTYSVSFFADTNLWWSAAVIVLVFAGGILLWRKRRRMTQRWQQEEEERLREGAYGSPPYVINYEIVRQRLHETPDDGTPPEPPSAPPGDSPDEKER